MIEFVMWSNGIMDYIVWTDQGKREFRFYLN